MKKTNIQKLCIAGLFGVIVGLMTGCYANRESVLAVTSTVIGVQIHQKDADKTPELKIGYARGEFAYVPTDKHMDTNAPGGSATNSANVLMEINAGCNFGLGVAYGGSVYQRLAVGSVAVSQPGAAVMMAKNDSGKIDANTATAIANAGKNVESIPTPAIDITARKRKVLDAYLAPGADKQKFEDAAKAAGYADFSDFCTKAETTDAGLKKVTDSLKSNGVNL